MGKNKQKKYLFYSIIAVLLLMSITIFRYTIKANSDDNKVKIKSAKITNIKTGTKFDSSDGIVEDFDGNMTSYTAGADSSEENRLVKSFDSITYDINFTIEGKNEQTISSVRTVDITVSLSEEEAKYVSFSSNSVTNESQKIYKFDNISTQSDSNKASITLYVLGAPNGTTISPKFTIKESTDSETGVILGKNDSGNLEYEYRDSRYTNTNRSTVTNYMPTIVSSEKGDLSLAIYQAPDGQKATYEGQTGRYFTEVVELYTTDATGKYFDDSVSYNLSVTYSGAGNVTMDPSWIRLYNTAKVGDIDSVSVDTAYSNESGGTANNETRSPGQVSFSNVTMTISGFNVLDSYPGVTASQKTISGKNVVGTYAISVFSPRTTDDSKNIISVTIDLGGNAKTFYNYYYESGDYNYNSGFYDESGEERLTKRVDLGAATNDTLSSSTSKGSSIVYRTDFKYKQTLLSKGIKEIIKVDPIAFRVIPFDAKKDIKISVSCGEGDCNVSDKDFELKFVSGNFDYSTGDTANYSITEVDPRLVSENVQTTNYQCNTLRNNLQYYSSDQIMNLYGGPCITGNNEAIFDTIYDARNEDNTEIPITKVIVQTKEGVSLPNDVTVTVYTKLRVRNVTDITRSYQVASVAMTSDYDEALEYYAPVIADSIYTENNILNPNNYTRSTFAGNVVTNSGQKYADSIRIVNFTARQAITVTNELSDGQTKTSFKVDENETITYRISSFIEDKNELVGADDVWYIKNVRVNVFLPKAYLQYIEDTSLGTPEVDTESSADAIILTYNLPWTKPNMKIPDIYFNAKLNPTMSGTSVPITVYSTFNPININGEYDMSVVDARKANYTIYGTSSSSVLVSQSSEGKTIVDKDSEFTYILHAYNNSGKEVTDYVIEDILPYNKDERKSSINGSYQVKVTLPASQPEAKLYCSTKDPKNIKKEVTNKEDEFEECTADEFVNATAIRVTGINLTINQDMDPIRVTLKPTKNKFGNKYTNSFFGGNREYKEKDSNNITYKVISRTISGVVFYDVNQDGVRSDDEKLASGIAVTLYKIENGKLIKVNKGETTTDKDGAYKFENLEAGLYKIRMQYDSGKYDLTLRYGTENRAIDSDAYKIKEGLAEISSKHTPKQIDGIDLTIFDNNKIENMDMGLIPRTVFGFEMKKYITQVDLNYNGTLSTNKYNNQSEVSLTVRNTKSVALRAYYGIAIKNNSFKAGYVKLVQEDIPAGMSFDSSDPYNAQWFAINGVLQSSALQDKVVEPGETVYLQIALDLPNREEAGTFINNVSVLEIEKFEKDLAEESQYLPGVGYKVSDEVTYAGVNWNVVKVDGISLEQAKADLAEQGITEESENYDERLQKYMNNNQELTLLAASGTISSTKSHTSSLYKWSESAINKYINGDWLSTNSLNPSTLKDIVICDDSSSLEGTSYGGTISGSCTSNVFVTNKIRLLTKAEYDEVLTTLDNLHISNRGWLYGNRNFWLMDAVDSTINHNYYGVQTNTAANNNVKYVVSSNSNTNNEVSATSGATNMEVRPVITISSKKIIE